MFLGFLIFCHFAPFFGPFLHKKCDFSIFRKNRPKKGQNGKKSKIQETSFVCIPKTPVSYKKSRKLRQVARSWIFFRGKKWRFFYMGFPYISRVYPPRIIEHKNWTAGSWEVVEPILDGGKPGQKHILIRKKSETVNGVFAKRQKYIENPILKTSKKTLPKYRTLHHLLQFFCFFAWNRGLGYEQNLFLGFSIFALFTHFWDQFRANLGNFRQ